MLATAFGAGGAVVDDASACMGVWLHAANKLMLAAKPMKDKRIGILKALIKSWIAEIAVQPQAARAYSAQQYLDES